MNKTIIFIILIFSTHTTRNLHYGDAKKDFDQKIRDNIRHLEIKSTLDEAEQIYYQFYHVDSNRQTAVHAINIGLTNSKSEKAITLHLESAARPDLHKPLAYYYIEEMNFQWVVINELVSRMMIAPDLKKAHDIIYLNLLQDVRAKIINDNKELKVETSFLTEEKKVHLKLMSKESIVAIFNIDIQSVRPTKSKTNLFNETNYIMNIEMILSQKNVDEIKTLQIDMITEDKDHFQNKMNQLMGIIDLKNYINNNENNLTIVSNYLKSKLLNTKVTSNPANTDNIVFDIKFENQTAQGILKYVPPVAVSQLGSYNLEIVKEGEKIKNLEFKRMSNTDFENFVKTNKIDDIFKSIFEEIMEMFKKKYQETHNSAFPGYLLKDFKKTSLIDSDEKGLIAQKGTDNIIQFMYQEKDKNIILSFNAKNPNFILSEQFPKEIYHKPVVEEFINYILTQHIVLKNSLAPKQKLI
jgi:hypothetical protein